MQNCNNLLALQTKRTEEAKSALLLTIKLLEKLSVKYSYITVSFSREYLFKQLNSRCLLSVSLILQFALRYSTRVSDCSLDQKSKQQCKKRSTFCFNDFSNRLVCSCRSCLSYQSSIAQSRMFSIIEKTLISSQYKLKSKLFLEINLILPINDIVALVLALSFVCDEGFQTLVRSSKQSSRMLSLRSIYARLLQF